MNVTKRESGSQPEQLRVLSRLHDPNGMRGEITAWSHPLGFEIRLLMDTAFIRSQVVRDASQIDAIASQWCDALLAKNWRVTE